MKKMFLFFILTFIGVIHTQQVSAQPAIYVLAVNNTEQALLNKQKIEFSTIIPPRGLIKYNQGTFTVEEAGSYQLEFYPKVGAFSLGTGSKIDVEVNSSIVFTLSGEFPPLNTTFNFNAGDTVEFIISTPVPPFFLNDALVYLNLIEN
jgi:hypothetical protein